MVQCPWGQLVPPKEPERKEEEKGGHESLRKKDEDINLLNSLFHDGESNTPEERCDQQERGRSKLLHHSQSIPFSPES